MNTIAVPRRILVVALDNLGDLVFASALTAPLRQAFPSATIDVWCKAYTADVASLIPHVNEVIAADPFWAVPKHSKRPWIGSFVKSVIEVRRRQYDVAVLSEAPWRTAAAVAATAIPARIGLARHRNHTFLTHVLPAANVDRPVLEEQARLLAPLGVESRYPRYCLDTEPLEMVRSIVGAELPPTFAALHPFAGAANRCVPLTEWTQLAFALHGRRIPVLWIGMTHELNTLRGITHPRGYYSDHVGDGTLASSTAAISLASVFAGHDSGPLHVAGAFGVPVVGVFAPGQPRRTFPQGGGPSRTLLGDSPSEIKAGMILHEIDALRLSSAT